VTTDLVIDWDDYLAQAQTGDVLLFRGTSAISLAVEVGTMGPYSHAAMVIIGPNGRKLLWEANPTPIVDDPLVHKPVSGSQIGDLDAAVKQLASGGDSPWVRQLTYQRPAGFDSDALTYVEAMTGTPFGALEDMVLNFLVGHYLRLPSPTEGVFCAELVALTYQHLGLLDTTPPPNFYSPTSWSSTSTDVSLLAGSLAPDTKINLPSS
jgi:hypothetical protein